jgi:hypothetical protein
VAPVVPTLPSGAVVGIWFGANGMGLRLQGASFNTLINAKCVNGVGTSIFGQVAYCNAPAFFSAANQQIQAKKLIPPALGTAKDGMTCPTVRDFVVVDQDQSDNVTTSYRITQDGKIAQNTAAMYQQDPVALVPRMDPMTLVNGQPNLMKQNLYRMGVDQPTVATATQAVADQKAYCQNLMKVAPTRLELDKQWTSLASSLDPAVSNSFYTFLAVRLDFTFGPSGLNCTGLLGVSSPVQLVQSNGIVVDATLTGAGA